MPIIWVVSELASKARVPRLEGSLLNVLSWLMGQKDGAAHGEWGTQPAPPPSCAVSGWGGSHAGEMPRVAALFALGLAVFGL